MARERKVGLGPMGSSQRSIVYGVVGFGASLGLIAAILSIIGPGPVLLVPLGLWLLLVVRVLRPAFRKGVLSADSNRAKWAAFGLGIGFALGFAGLFAVLYAFPYAVAGLILYAFLYGFEWLILIFIIAGLILLTRSFLQMRQEWPRTSPPTRRFVRNLLMVNVPTIAFLISYLFIVFPHTNSLLALSLAYIVYAIPNGVVFAKRFKELLSSRSLPNGEPKDRKL